MTDKKAMLAKESAKPTKSKRRPPRRRSRFRWFSFILSLAVLAVIGGIGWAFLPASRSPKRVLVEIPNRSSAKEIAFALKKRGVIRSEFAFLIMARFLGEASHLQPGDYEIEPRMTPAQIVTLLSRGKSLSVWVTIPEGYGIRQIAAALREKRLGDSARFERIARMGGRSFRDLSFIPPPNLEGFLFPETYKFRRNASERSMIHQMLQTFDDRAAKPLKSGFLQAERNGRSMQSVIILASMVEREARQNHDRSIIAGVLMNRLRRGMKLQVDATIQYALAAPKRRLLYKDLQIASPYNTYKIAGMPPGPICNPGLDAIQAALHPAMTNALFYVAKPDGTHIFTRTLADHDAARAKVKRLAKARS